MYLTCYHLTAFDFLFSVCFVVTQNAKCEIAEYAYTFFDNPKSFDAAQKKCRSLPRGEIAFIENNPAADKIEKNLMKLNNRMQCIQYI